MEQISSIHMGLARWILTGALLLASLIGAVAALIVLPPTYQSDSSIVLLASPVASQPYGDNPYLSFTPSLTLTADVVSSELMSTSTVSHLAAQGFRDSYTVEPPSDTADTTGSVLLVTVTGSTKASAEVTLQGVTSEINKVLASLQYGIRRVGQIRAVTISVSPPSRSFSSEARLLTVLIGGGVVVSFGIPWIVATRITDRRLRRTALPVVTAPRPAGPASGEHRPAATHAAHGHARGR
jgi:capsular polysaccharide biosynthesis protein